MQRKALQMEWIKQEIEYQDLKIEELNRTSKNMKKLKHMKEHAGIMGNY